MESVTRQVPARRAVDTGKLNRIYDNIEKDIAKLLEKPDTVDVMRVVLMARKTQMRGEEVKLQQMRLYLQFTGNGHRRRMKRVDAGE